MKLILMLVEPIAWLCSRKSSVALAHKIESGGGGYSYQCLHTRKPCSPALACQTHCLFATGSGNISMHAV